MLQHGECVPEIEAIIVCEMCAESNQSTKQAINVLVSLMQNNALERLKEQVHAKRDSLDDNQKVEELDNILSFSESKS